MDRDLVTAISSVSSPLPSCATQAAGPSGLTAALPGEALRSTADPRGTLPFIVPPGPGYPWYCGRPL